MKRFMYNTLYFYKRINRKHNIHDILSYIKWMKAVM